MKLALHDRNELLLKQSLIPQELMRDTTSSGALFVLCAGILVLSGLPALLVSQIWTVLDVSPLLNISLSGDSVFRMIYIAGLGCCLPLLAMLGGFKLLSSNLDRLAATLEITDHGICWKSDNLLTALTLRLARQPLVPIAWNRIMVVSMFETPRQLTNEYNLEVPGLTLDTLQTAVGSYGNLNFIGTESGKFRSLLSVSLAGLSKESKHNLASMISSHAKTTVITKTAVEELIGASVETRDLSYTDIWLNVLHSKDEQKRTGDLTPGDLLNEGQLTIIRKLATGGQANLFLAEREDGENVVLKEYIISTIDTESAMIGLEEFESESMILERISHLNAGKMLGVFAEHGRPYIVLEYYKGRSLREIVDASGPLDHARVVPIAHQLSNVLAYLHSLEPAVIHRDVSPDNVIVMDDNSVKLIDFSVARQGESSEACDFVGKASYVSPDQFRGFVSRKNDVYGFGATLFFALAGKDPEPISQLYAPVMVAEPVNLGDCKLENRSVDLAAVIYKCTEIDQSNPSYESMLEIVREFQIDH